MNQQRRGDDPRIDALVQDVCLLKKDMAQNTEVTMQVRDILASFRVIAKVAKWLTAIATAVAAVYAAIKTGWGFHHPTK